MSTRRFRPREHLRAPADFRNVYDLRCSAGDDLLVVYGRKNNLDFSRLGLSVGRKVGGAVRRNRWKRLLREAYRLERAQLPSGVDWILIPRVQQPPELGRLMRSLRTLSWRVCRKLGPDLRHDAVPKGR